MAQWRWRRCCITAAPICGLKHVIWVTTLDFAAWTDEKWHEYFRKMRDNQACCFKLRVEFSTGRPTLRQGWPLSETADNTICGPFAQFTWWQSLRNLPNRRSFKHMVISSWLGRKQWYMGLKITKFWGRWGLNLSQKWNDCARPLKKPHQTIGAGHTRLLEVFNNF